MNIYNLLNNFITLQELLNYYNASITFINLPKKIYAFVFNYKGINNIIVNDNLSYCKKKKSVIHELAHIELNQLNQVDNDLFAFKIDNYEDEADRYIENILIIIAREKRTKL